MNLKESLSLALERLGVDASRFQFDDHSTIAMSFEDVGEVFLDPQSGDKVWLWGMLEEMDDHARDALAAPLLAEVTRPVAHWQSGALTLRQDGRVGGLLCPECVDDPGQLAAALQDFHQCLVRLKSIR